MRSRVRRELIPGFVLDFTAVLFESDSFYVVLMAPPASYLLVMWRKDDW